MSVVWAGVHAFEAAVDEVVARMSEGARKSVEEASSRIEAKAKDNAPVRTGTLRRGIRTDPITAHGEGGWRTEVGPTVIYSRRIELGYTGPDSRGRIYHQDADPYFTPAFEEVAAQATEIYLRDMGRAILD